MNSFADRYLKQQAHSKPFLTENPPSDLFLIVVIPAYNEPNLLSCINSLAACYKCSCSVEVLIVINESEGTSNEVITQNQTSLDELHDWKKEHPDASFTLHIIHPAPFKHKFRGVGSARKIGMDEAIYRYHTINQPDGIIISLDADTLVEKNYFLAIESFFLATPDCIGCTINFKHRISELENSLQQEGMRIYEQYLHYYKQALEFTGYPHAIYTIGSAFAFRAHAYVKQGGMPRRQAGEDFYFLHKLTNMGSLSELNSTCVYPSARTSNRVPFGTGPGIQKWLDGDKSISMSYSLKAFIDLRNFFATIPTLYVSKNQPLLAPSILNFLTEENFWENILPEIRANSGNLNSFEKRFFQYFNAFKVIKFLNYSHPKPYQFSPIDLLSKELNELKLGTNCLK